MVEYCLLKETLSYDPLTGSSRYVKRAKGRSVDKEPGTLNTNGYLVICIDGKRYLAHRLYWYLHYGYWPSEHIDHINGDKLDNRIQNLREATISQNQRNKPSKGYSFHKGSGRFQARIHVEGKTTYLGWFKTEEEASKAFEESKEKFHGAYAYKGKEKIA
jgi:hypothetical protein